jgi:hypothetical protein
MRIPITRSALHALAEVDRFRSEHRPLRDAILPSGIIAAILVVSLLIAGWSS